jgi:hypothetical protein
MSGSRPSAIRAWLAAALLVAPLGAGAQKFHLQLRSAIGTNLEAVSYWSTQVPFVDVLKTAAEWSANDGKALDRDQYGNVRSLAPGQIANRGTLHEMAGRYPGGVYVVRYKGEGTLAFRYDAKVLSRKPGEIRVQVTPSDGGIRVELTATNPANYLRDIEMIMPGGICEGDPFTHVASAAPCARRPYLAFAEHRELLFYPVFLERLRGYSVLRFMDWTRTNNSSVANWSERALPSHVTWMEPRGVPAEVMIALANTLGAHPWFTIPHRADDAYVQSFAGLLKERLTPALGVYLEHSNEVWNSMFAQFGHAKAQGAAQRPPLDGAQYHALRTRAIGAIFKATLGAERVMVVLGAQAANPATATQGLDLLKSRYGASALGIDAVAIAPYLAVFANPSNARTYTSMSVDALFQHLRSTALPTSAQHTGAYRALAKKYGVRLVAYEGGQHLNGVLGGENDPAVNALFDSANRDPRMKPLYLEYLAGWKSAGGELFVHFNDVSRWDKWGRWGALEYVAQPRAQAPKFDALHLFIEQNPAWWAH